MRRIVPPIRGRWPGGSPDLVELNGRVYQRARWRAPSPGTRDQYRERTETNARHLYVGRDGTYTIDHTDAHNPDAGRPVSHLVTDVPAVRVGLFLLLVAACYRYATLNEGDDT